jgi:hypothetical protein
MSRRTDFIFYLLLTLLLTAFIPLIASTNGIELTHDSGYYVQAAKSFASNGLFLDIHGNRLTLYPPGYALWLSFYTYSGLDILTYALWSNVLFFFVLLLCSIALVKKAISNPVIRLIAFVSIGLSTVILQNGVFLWSDLLFIVCSVAYFLALTTFLETKNGLSFFLLILFSVAGFYVRYIGITFLFSTGIALIFSEHFTFGEKTNNIISYGIYSGFFLVLWLVRNYVVSGTMSMDYEEGTKTLFQNIADTLQIIATYFIPNSFSSTIKLLFSSLLLLTGLFYSFKIRKQLPVLFNVLTSFITGYTGFFILLNTFKDICDFDDRYLSPVYIPVILATFILIDKAVEQFQFKTYALFLLCVWISYPAFRLYKNGLQWYYGAGYNTAAWKKDEMLHEVAELPQELVLSNNPIPIILLNNTTAYSLDYKNIREKDFYFVEWTNGEGLRYLNTSEKHFKEEHTLKEVKKLKHGILYVHTEKAYRHLMKPDLK